MQYPQPESYNPNLSSMGETHQPGPTSNQAHSTQPRPQPSSQFHPNSHFSSSHPPGYHPELYPHSYHSPHGRGSFFGPWFNQYLPPAPPATAPPLPASYHPPSSSNYHHRCYRRCGRPGRLLPLLIVGGVGYFAYRKLESKIEGVRSEISKDQHLVSVDSSVPQIDVVGKTATPNSVEEIGHGGHHWGWHGGRHFREREAERRRVEDDRKRGELEMKMKEWEEAVREEKERKENSRWI
ncbi:hypothetical protein JCM5353_004326 [Sporobolomyces roseus]